MKVFLQYKLMLLSLDISQHLMCMCVCVYVCLCIDRKALCLQFSSVAQSCRTLCNLMDCSTPGFPVHHQLPELAQNHVHQVGDAIQPSHLMSSPSLPAFNSSQHQGLCTNESVLCIRWPKYWSFSFSISPSSKYSGLISFRMDWLDLLAVQGTLKSLLQHHSWKASILRHSAFFIVQLSHPYMTTGKTIALTRQTFVGKVMSLLFNMLSSLVIAFFPRSKHLLISWLWGIQFFFFPLTVSFSVFSVLCFWSSCCLGWTSKSLFFFQKFYLLFLLKEASWLPTFLLQLFSLQRYF